MKVKFESVEKGKKKREKLTYITKIRDRETGQLEERKETYINDYIWDRGEWKLEEDIKHKDKIGQILNIILGIAIMGAGLLWMLEAVPKFGG